MEKFIGLGVQLREERGFKRQPNCLLVLCPRDSYEAHPQDPATCPGFQVTGQLVDSRGGELRLGKGASALKLGAHKEGAFHGGSLSEWFWFS